MNLVIIIKELFLQDVILNTIKAFVLNQYLQIDI